MQYSFNPNNIYVEVKKLEDLSTLKKIYTKKIQEKNLKNK